MKKTILFIINPISGTSGKAKLPALIDKRLDTEIYDRQIVWTERPGHGVELSAEAARQGVDVVVAVGGDGTVNEVARGLAHTQTALGIVPCGSGNGLARHLLLPMNTEKAIDVINRCETKELDYGVIDGHPFFCTCGMGFDAFISQKFAEAGKRGPVTYVQKILEDGLTYKPETYQLSDSTGHATYKAFLVSCANASQYGNNAYIAPQASMSDGLMDVVIMEPFDLLEAPQIAIDMFSKTLDKSSKIKSFQTPSLHVRRSAPGVIHFDGDPAMAGAEIDVHIEAKGFKAIVNTKGDKRSRLPNAIQTAAAELFNELSMIRGDITRHTRRGITLTKLLQRKIGESLN